MIHAVCFHRASLTYAALEDICRAIGTRSHGRLVDESLVNCIESMQDGTVWLSFMDTVPPDVYDCGADVERFIHVNRTYGNIRGRKGVTP